MSALLALLLLAAGAPDPAASLERDVRALIGIRTSSAPSLSPDGKRVAFLSNITGSPQGLDHLDRGRLAVGRWSWRATSAIPRPPTSTSSLPERPPWERRRTSARA